MSQFFVGVTDASLPSDVPITFDGDIGSASANNHVINFRTLYTTGQFLASLSTVTLDFFRTDNNIYLGVDPINLTSFAVQNTAIGSFALSQLSDGDANTAIGFSALASLQGAFVVGLNTAIGSGTLTNLTQGNSNIAIGVSSGSNYILGESENILIDNSGILGESSIIRIGSTQTDCYLQGTLRTNAGRVVNTTIPGSYPYTVKLADYAIFVDSSSARTILLLGSPATGRVVKIKDATGSANANHITINGNGNTIDGSGINTISTNYGSVELTYNGSQWSIT